MPGASAIAVLSDVHANLEALTAVMADVRQRGIERAFFLGDLVGYGPNPREVLDYIWKFEFCLMGNHDRAVLTGPPRHFNPIARRATSWTRQQIHPAELPMRFLRKKEYELRKRYWEFLLSRKPFHRAGEMYFAHDNPTTPGNDQYVRKVEDAELAFRQHPEVRAFFIGHSHVPRIFRPGRMERPETGKKYPFDGKVLVNVGSVGQPRDKDPRSCYVVLDDGFRFVRVEYDVKTTQEKIRRSPLDDSLAERLAKGQ
jgi:predicted phosphodiesterase